MLSQMTSFFLKENVYLFETEKESMNRGEGERERIPSRFRAVCAELLEGLDLMNHEIMT